MTRAKAHISSCLPDWYSVPEYMIKIKVLHITKITFLHLVVDFFFTKGSCKTSITFRSARLEFQIYKNVIPYNLYIGCLWTVSVLSRQEWCQQLKILSQKALLFQDHNFVISSFYSLATFIAFFRYKYKKKDFITCIQSNITMFWLSVHLY